MGQHILAEVVAEVLCCDGGLERSDGSKGECAEREWNRSWRRSIRMLCCRQWVGARRGVGRRFTQHSSLSSPSPSTTENFQTNKVNCRSSTGQIISALVAKMHNHQALQISSHFLILIGFLANAPTFLLQPTRFFFFDLLACMQVWTLHEVIYFLFFSLRMNIWLPFKGGMLRSKAC